MSRKLERGVGRDSRGIQISGFVRKDLDVWSMWELLGHARLRISERILASS